MKPDIPFCSHCLTRHALSDSLRQEVAQEEKVEQALNVNRRRIKTINYLPVKDFYTCNEAATDSVRVCSSNTLVQLLRERVLLSASEQGFEEDVSCKKGNSTYSSH